MMTTFGLNLDLYQTFKKTLGAYKTVFFRFTSLQLGLLSLKFKIDFKNGLNLENPMTNESADTYPPFF